MSRYISNALKEKIRQEAKFRCGYCLRSELLIGMPMEFEHLVPLALGGQTVEENLWLSCRRCNEFKGIQIQGFDSETSENAPIFNPRTQIWSEHFSWSIDGTEVLE
jgi:5-methylcytosine-specific restriction endonuclease McrA